MILDKTIPFQERINFVIYVFSRVLLSIGDHVYLFAVSYFILFETGSAFYFSINMAISVIVNLMLLPFAGMMSDLGNKRNIVIMGEMLYTFFIFLLLIYSSLFSISLIAIYATTFFTSLINPFISNSFQTAMTEMFHRTRIQKVSGYISSIMSIAMIAGPIIGGILYGMLEFTQIIFIFFILFLLSTLLDFFLKFDLYSEPIQPIKNKTKIEASSLQNFKLEIGQGIRFIRKNPILKRMFFMFATINFFLATISIFPEKMMITELSFSPEMVSYINAILGIGGIMGGLIIGISKKIISPLSVQKSALISIAFIIGLYPLPIYFQFENIYNFIYIGVIGFVFTISMQYANIPVMTFLQLVIPQHIKGRVFSNMTLINMSLMPLGSIIYGILYDLNSYWVINLISCIGLLLIAFLTYTKPVLTESRDMYQKVLKEADEELEENSYASAEASS